MKGQGRRIAITGYGVVAPCGLGKEAYWKGLLGPGLSNVGRSTEIEAWDSSPYYSSPKEARRADLSEQYAIAAATEAIEQAGPLSVERACIGTIFGTGVGGIHTLEEQIVVRIERGERRVSPFLVPMMMANAPGAAVSMRFGLQGPNETICTACAAGTHALGLCRAADRMGPGRCGRDRRHRARRNTDVAREFRQHDGALVDGNQPSVRHRS